MPYKVPFRAVYCETRWVWFTACLVCLYRTVMKHVKPLPPIPGVS